MRQIRLAGLWAAALLSSSLAAAFGFIADATAQGLLVGLLLGAGVSLGQAGRGASC